MVAASFFAPVPTATTARWFVATLVAAALLLRLALALVLPYDGGPDERRRYPVTAQIYATGRTPRYGTETWHHYVVKPMLAYRLNALAAHFIPLALPLYIKLRLGSVLAGVAAVVAGYAAARALWPASVGRALAVAAVLAFYPQLVFLSSYLNADAYTIAANALLFWLLALAVRIKHLTLPLAVGIGGALGLVFLGRENGYAGFLLAGLALLPFAAEGHRYRRELLVAAAVALAFPVLFYAQQQLAYGSAFLPLLGGSGIAWVPPGWSVADAFARLPLDGFDYPVFHLIWSNPKHWAIFGAWLVPSAFGVFGYMDVWLPFHWYALFVLMVGASVAGWHRLSSLPASLSVGGVDHRRWLLAGSIVAILTLAAAVLRHNFSVIFQPQGRYLLPLAVPGAVWGVMGWYSAILGKSRGFWVAFGVSFVIMSGGYSFWKLLTFYG